MNFISCHKILGIRIKLNFEKNWEAEFQNFFDLNTFYHEVENFLDQFEEVLPVKDLIFEAFRHVKYEKVRLVIYGEDPYPRKGSANGIAFWDAEIKEWSKLSHGNSLKHILKALLIHNKLATHDTTIAECREIAKRENFKSPKILFEHWLKNGVLLINSAMTFTNKADKKKHFIFWEAFQKNLIKVLAQRKDEIYYLLWGNKANKWRDELLANDIAEEMIISQNHPTFQHQFLYKNGENFSPFSEIISKTKLDFLTQIKGN